jgi:hypothetical protein
VSGERSRGKDEERREDLVLSDVCIESRGNQTDQTVNIELSESKELGRDIGGWRDIEHVVRPDQLTDPFQEVSGLCVWRQDLSRDEER